MNTNNDVKVGQRYKDNDPRSGERLVTVKSISGDVATCSSSTSKRDTWIRLGAMYQDGKPRRTGFSLVDHAERPQTPALQQAGGVVNEEGTEWRGEEPKG